MSRGLLCLTTLLLFGFALSCNDEPAVGPSQPPNASDPPTPPALLGAPTVATYDTLDVRDTRATLTGTVNPNGRPTTWYFQYGTGASDGSMTDPQSIGNAVSPIAVAETLKSLKPSTEYFWRLVAVNDSGTCLSPMQTFWTCATPPPPPPPPPVHLSTVLPSEVGTQWNYTYSTYSSPNSTPVWGGYVYDSHAAFSWTIASADSVSDSLVCLINVTGQDTVHNTHYEYGVIVSDTVYTTQVHSQWRMIFFQDQVILDWYSSINPQYPFTHTVLQSSIESTDTLKIGGYIYGGTEYFVRGVGLVGFIGGHANQTTWSKQELKLSSWSPPRYQSVTTGVW